jgi:hypothetical protein
MSGKAILFLVMSFSVIFLIMGRNLGDVSTRSVQNSVGYYTNTVAHEIAVSGANLAAAKISANALWDSGFGPTDFNGGKFETTVEHDADRRIVTTIGKYDTSESRVEMIIAPSTFSKYAYYSGDEGSGIIYWMTKDTVWGPFHTQDYLYVSGRPCFYGPVSTKLGLKKQQKSDKPQFLGGYEEGDLEMPSNGVSKLKENALNFGGKVFNLKTTSTTVYNSFYLTFKNDSVTYKIDWTDKSSGHDVAKVTTQTVLTSSLTANGIIYIEGTKDLSGNTPLDVRLKGTVKGQYTVGTSGSFYLDDDIKYYSDPQDGPSSDVLGIVAKKDVIITDNTANRHDIDIQASVYAETGGFGAENYGSRPVSGTINLYGGIIQYIRKAVGEFDSGKQKVTNGFSKRYRYDERFLAISPPYFPGTGTFEILSWYE